MATPYMLYNKLFLKTIFDILIAKMVTHGKKYVMNAFVANRGADRRRGPCKQTQFDCAVHGVRSSSLCTPGMGVSLWGSSPL